MSSKSFIAAACAAATVLAAGTSAFAQAAPAAAPQITHGAAPTGVCIVSVEQAIGGSTVGKYVDTRLQQITAQVNAELNAEKTGIDNDAKTLDGQRATLGQDVFEQRASALQVRANALQRKAQQRDREMQATEQKAYGRVAQELDPLVRQAYQAKGCALLLNRNAVLIANPAMDLTPQVTTALNGKLTQFAFDRERMDQAAAPAAAR